MLRYLLLKFILECFLYYSILACSSKSKTTVSPKILSTTVMPTSENIKPTPAFTYADPSTWPGTCAIGKQQSPVDIKIVNLEVKPMEPLQFNDYDSNGTIDASNNGHTGFVSWSKQPSISGGGLEARYVLTQFHFHWDGKDNFGSEHTINGLHYPLELHFVHIREDLSEATAGTVQGGIAVVSVFFQLSTNGTALFDLDNLFMGTIQPNEDKEQEYYSPGGLLPQDTSTFFRYNGSLTTPPCSEGVIWTILESTNYVTEAQLTDLRKLLTEEDELLIDNWRPVQALNGRTVYLVKT